MSGSAVAAAEPPRSIELPVPVDAALQAVEDAAEVWGAEWHRDGTGGSLVLPVTAGIRLGMIEGAVRGERQGDRSKLHFEVARTQYRVHVAALVVLLLGAAGALLTVVAPLVPPLLELLPIGGLLALLAWFLVVARFRSRNTADFFALVEQVAEENRRGAAAESENTEPEDTSAAR